MEFGEEEGVKSTAHHITGTRATNPVTLIAGNCHQNLNLSVNLVVAKTLVNACRSCSICTPSCKLTKNLGLNSALIVLKWVNSVFKARVKDLLQSNETRENRSTADGAGEKFAGDSTCENLFWCPKKVVSA